jgi:alcohol dehydrogenase (cytochrome c)
MNRKFVLKASVAALLLAGMATTYAGPVSDQMLAKDPGESWLHANGNWAGHRYSTLSQINNSNAKDLKIAWMTSVGAKTD